MILVTGANGHLGANLLRRLLADGEEVRVLLRPKSDNSSMAGLAVEPAYGDLRDPRSEGTSEKPNEQFLVGQSSHKSLVCGVDGEFDEPAGRVHDRRFRQGQTNRRTRRLGVQPLRKDLGDQWCNAR